MEQKLCILCKGFSQEDIFNRVQDVTHKCVQDPSIANMRLLCGALSYSTLFLINDFELETGKQYTLENTCKNVPGLLKIPFHDIMSNVMFLTVKMFKLPEYLYNILDDCMYGEAIDMLGVSARRTYYAFLRVYCKLMNTECDADKDASVNDLQKYFYERFGEHIGY